MKVGAAKSRHEAYEFPLGCLIPIRSKTNKPLFLWADIAVRQLYFDHSDYPEDDQI